MNEYIAAAETSETSDMSPRTGWNDGIDPGSHEDLDESKIYAEALRLMSVVSEARNNLFRFEKSYRQTGKEEHDAYMNSFLEEHNTIHGTNTENSGSEKDEYSIYGEPRELELSPGYKGGMENVLEEMIDFAKPQFIHENLYVDYAGQRIFLQDVFNLGVKGFFEKYLGYDRDAYKEHERLKHVMYTAQDKRDEFIEAEQVIPKMIRKTAGLISPDEVESWEERFTRELDGYRGLNLASSVVAVELMDAHNSGADQEKLRDIFKKADLYSFTAFSEVKRVIGKYYKDGESLVEIINK